MSAFLPARPPGSAPPGEQPRLEQEPLSPAQRRARWEVRAAQWKAYELAEHVFGGVSRVDLTGMRAAGPLRGLLRLDVPFVDLVRHQELEGRFLAAVACDPLLSNVGLVYVIGPAAV